MVVTDGSGPLTGIRVVDLGRYQAGPRCALHFARLGAEVIKIEAPGGDESRENGPWVRGQSAYWVQYNSGKKSLTLNLRHEKGKHILRELVKVSDVLLQNFRPGTMDTMGFGYETLKSLNPGIVMINVSAYGQYGPYRDRLGFDPIGQALSGHMMMTGSEGMGPIKTYFPVIDRITALHATIAGMAALWERQRSGEGQYVDAALADSGYSMMEIDIARFMGSGAVAERSGNRIATPPNNTFRCKDGWVYVTGGNRDIFTRVARLIGRPQWLEDPRFLTRDGRIENADEIEAGIGEWLAEKNVAEAVEAFSKASVPAAPVNDVPAAARDPHPWARDLLVEVTDPVSGTIHVAGDYFHFSRSQVVVGPVPAPGQHTREVLCGLLGYSEKDMEALSAEGVV
ncbi:MAG: CoA transferase [Chloroflexi bacterium]|nr:CoA transferase [Chloroflexota bacterium]